MNGRIFKILNIRKEEQKPVVLLMIFSFLIGLSLTFYFTAANAIFLKHFKPGMISLSYVASGIMVYLVWWGLSRIDRRLSLPTQIVIKILFVFISVLLIGTGVWAYDTPWLAFLLFTWIRVMVYVTVVTFWGLAGKMFDIRQGKRIFGLIGTGEVLSIIIGYFSVPLILAFLSVADLLFLSSATLLGCLLMVMVILRQLADHIGLNPHRSNAKTDGQRQDWNYWRLLRQPYFLLISLMALLPIFGYLSVDFLFLAQTKREFSNNPETIARFLGIFLGFTAIVELGFKLLSGHFLTRYGMRPGLLALPAILAFGILMSAIFGLLYGETGLFFAFIAFSRLFERAVRGSIYEPAFQLLYQPVPEEKRMVFQNQIEGIPKALGTILTGAIIFGLSRIPEFHLNQYNIFFLFVLGIWIWMAFRMYEAYRSFIRQKLAGMPVKDAHRKATARELMERRLSQTNAGDFRKVFTVYHRLNPLLAEKALANSLHGAPPDVGKIIQELTGELFPANASGIPPEELSASARSENSSERERVAFLLGFSHRYNAYRVLLNLLKDPVPAVRKTAIISAGRLRRQELWPVLFDHLTQEEYLTCALIAMKMAGEAIIGEADREFDKLSGNRHTQIRILQMFEEIGGDKALRALRSRIGHTDPEIRSQALISLCNMNYRASLSEQHTIHQTIGDVVRSIAYILASLRDLEGSPHHLLVQEALMQEMEERKEGLFMLLSLLYDPTTIGHIRESIESPDRRARIYALEILDLTVPEDIKEMFQPLYEDLPLHERLQRLNSRFPQEELTPEERLLDMVQQDFSNLNYWTRACAIEVSGKIMQQLSPSAKMVLSGCMAHPERIIREVAGRVLNRNGEKVLFDVVVDLKETSWLAPVPEMILIPLAETLQRIKSREINMETALDFIQGNPLLTERFLDHSIHENR